MPTESELRNLLQDEPGGTSPLDADRIIRSARARRRPKRFAVGALGGLAAAAVIVPVSLGSLPPLGASDSGGAAAPAAEQEAADGMSTLAERGGSGSLHDDPYPNCHLLGWDGEAVPSGVTLQLSQPVAGGDVVLTLANGTASPLVGELAGTPYLALSSGEAPVGWSAAEVAPMPLELAPGERLDVVVPLETIGCEGAALAGDYGAEASLGIRLADGTVLVANSVRTPVVVGAAQ